jgi:hypothetical protein
MGEQLSREKSRQAIKQFDEIHGVEFADIRCHLRGEAVEHLGKRAVVCADRSGKCLDAGICGRVVGGGWPGRRHRVVLSLSHFIRCRTSFAVALHSLSLLIRWSRALTWQFRRSYAVAWGQHSGISPTTLVLGA